MIFTKTQMKGAKEMNRNKGQQTWQTYGVIYGQQWTLLLSSAIISSASGIIGTYAIRPLINDFIETGFSRISEDALALSRLAILIASYFSARLMVTVGQNTIENAFIQPYSKFANCF